MGSELVITHLSWRESEPCGKVPFLRVNCTFQVSEEDPIFSVCLARTLDHQKRIVTDSLPEPNDFSSWKESWVLTDPYWVYLEKFRTFWFRECASDCGVTRNCLSELEFYKVHGALPSVHRFRDSNVVVRYLETLHNFWD